MKTDRAKTLDSLPKPALLGIMIVFIILAFVAQERLNTQRGELSHIEDGRKLRAGSLGERLLDLGLRQLTSPCAHKRAHRRLLRNDARQVV